MNEIYDKLILRIFFTVFICIIIVLYKYAHAIIYPSTRMQLFKSFKPSKNSSDTIHLFSRIIGLGILFSEFHFYLSDGILIALTDFFIKGSIVSVIYLISIYILDSIALYNFEYSDEILKRKNYSYALICFTNAIVSAYLLKTIVQVSHSSITLFIFLWLFVLVLIGLVTKAFPVLSKLSFNRLMVQKNLALAFSYMGFIWGWGIIISFAIENEIQGIQQYAIFVILKILLSIIIFPFFRSGLIWIFALKDDFNTNPKLSNETPELGHGIFEGTIYFTSCYLVSIITGQVHFGTFYPIF